MRFSIGLILSLFWLATSAWAQSQQAGNDASTNADDTFKQLIAKCDDTDALVLRARVRLAMGRLDDQAAIKELTDEVNKGLSLCGEGKIEEAKVFLNATLKKADTKVSEKFGQDETATVKAATEEKPKPSGEATERKAEEKKPWWQFW